MRRDELIVLVLLIIAVILIAGCCFVAGCAAPNAPVQSGEQIKISDGYLIDIYYVPETDCICHMVHTGTGVGLSCYPCKTVPTNGRYKGCPP